MSRTNLVGGAAERWGQAHPIYTAICLSPKEPRLAFSLLACTSCLRFRSHLHQTCASQAKTSQMSQRACSLCVSPEAFWFCSFDTLRPRLEREFSVHSAHSPVNEHTPRGMCSARKSKSQLTAEHVFGPSISAWLV